MTDDPHDTTDFEATTGFDDAVRQLGELRLSDAARQRHLSMLAELTSTPEPSQPQRGRLRRRVLAVGAAVVVASGAGVGAAAALGAFRSESPTDRRIAHCYTTDNLHDPGNAEDFTVASGNNPTEGDAASLALDICRGGWLQGRYSADNPKILLNPKPPPWRYPVPPLVACVLKTGEVGVFPGHPTTCTRLGLAVAKL